METVVSTRKFTDNDFFRMFPIIVIQNRWPVPEVRTRLKLLALMVIDHRDPKYQSSSIPLTARISTSRSSDFIKLSLIFSLNISQMTMPPVYKWQDMCDRTWGETYSGGTKPAENCLLINLVWLPLTRPRSWNGIHSFFGSLVHGLSHWRHLLAPQRRNVWKVSVFDKKNKKILR